MFCLYHLKVLQCNKQLNVLVKGKEQAKRRNDYARFTTTPVHLDDAAADVRYLADDDASISSGKKQLFGQHGR
jgi:hypothetical protein